MCVVYCIGGKANLSRLKHNCESFTAKQVPQGYLVVQIISAFLLGTKVVLRICLESLYSESFTQRNRDVKLASKP